MTPLLLTADELAELTGYVRPFDQRKWLTENDIVHRVRADGRPVVSRAHVEQRLGVAADSAATGNEEPPLLPHLGEATQ